MKSMKWKNRCRTWPRSKALAIVQLAWALCFLSQVAKSAQHPDIIVILADDLGWADVGYHGSDIPTPSIDRMALGGVEMNRFYVAAMCTPTRASLMTGRYWSRFGNTNPSNSRVLPEDTATLASVLTEAGYATALTGKWHLGSNPDAGPNQYGFQYSYGSLAGGVGPWLHTYKKGQYQQTWHRNGKFIHESGHVTDLIAADAIKFISKAQNIDQPYFLYLPFTAVHNPLQEPDKWIHMASELENDRPVYSACVMHMDHVIGQILDQIESVKRDTLVIFFSDNGGTIHPTDSDNGNYPGAYAMNIPLGRNHPLRGRKTEPFEGGVRVPAIIYAPAWLEARKIETPFHVIDLMPTILSLAGISHNPVNYRWDGSNRHNLIIGLTPDSPKSHAPFYWLGISRKSETILDFPWKWIKFHNDNHPREMLFNIEADPYESTDLSEFNKDIVEQMHELCKSLSLSNDSSLP